MGEALKARVLTGDRLAREVAGDAGDQRVERRADGFYFINPKTGQEFKLDGPADSQLARAAVDDRGLHGAAARAAVRYSDQARRPGVLTFVITSPAGQADVVQWQNISFPS